MNPEVKTMSHLCKVRGSGPNARQQPAQEAQWYRLTPARWNPTRRAEVSTSTRS